MVLAGTNYVDCLPAGCPAPSDLSEEEFINLFEVSNGKQFSNCSFGGPIPPETCNGFCTQDGVGTKTDTPITNSNGETITTADLGGAEGPGEVITCGWIYENQANLPISLFCRFEVQCCYGGNGDNEPSMAPDSTSSPIVNDDATTAPTTASADDDSSSSSLSIAMTVNTAAVFIGIMALV